LLRDENHRDTTLIAIILTSAHQDQTIPALMTVELYIRKNDMSITIEIKYITPDIPPPDALINVDNSCKL